MTDVSNDEMLERIAMASDIDGNNINGNTENVLMVKKPVTRKHYFALKKKFKKLNEDYIRYKRTVKSIVSVEIFEEIVKVLKEK